MGKLVLLLPDGSSLDIPLDRERITIGRRADNDICLPYPAVSGEHAAVVTILADSFLEDLNSTNGTLVNDSRIAKHFLREGDRIDIGLQQLVYHDDAAVGTGRDDPTPRSGRTLRTPSRDRAQSDVAPDEMTAVPATPDAGSSAAALAPNAPGDQRLQGGADNPSRARSSGLQVLADALTRARRRESEPSVAPSTAEGEDALPLAGDVDTSATPVADPLPRSAATDEPSPAVARPRAIQRMERPVLGEVRILSGARTGAVFVVTQAETVIGRPGERIVALRHADGVFRLVPLDGPAPVTLNGNPLAETGSPVVPGDTFEVAGTTLRLGLPGAGAG